MRVFRLTREGVFFFEEVRVIDFELCWIYVGPAYWDEGYPIISRHKKNWIASRFVWYILTGRDYFSREIHHKCKTRACINPFHLEELTKRKHRRWHNGHG